MKAEEQQLVCKLGQAWAKTQDVYGFSAEDPLLQAEKAFTAGYEECKKLTNMVMTDVLEKLAADTSIEPEVKETAKLLLNAILEEFK